MFDLENAKFIKTDVSNFYLMTPLEKYECLRMNMKTTPEEITKECELSKLQHNGWVHVEIRKELMVFPKQKC